MNYLSLELAERVVLRGEPFAVAPEAMREVERCYHFLEQFHKDKVIFFTFNFSSFIAYF